MVQIVSSICPSERPCPKGMTEQLQDDSSGCPPCIPAATWFARRLRDNEPTKGADDDSDKGNDDRTKDDDRLKDDDRTKEDNDCMEEDDDRNKEDDDRYGLRMDDDRYDDREDYDHYEDDTHNDDYDCHRLRCTF